jgi:regulatory protein
VALPRPPSLKVKALQWLAQREHSRQELGNKLLRLLARTQPEALNASAGAGAANTGEHDEAPGLADAPPSPSDAEQVDTLLNWLEQRGYLSQERFIESRIHARQSRFGNTRIRQELQQHGVSLDADTLAQLRQTEYTRAAEVWRRKYGSAPADAAERVRQVRFLAGRGFSMDVVQQVIRHGASAAAGSEH